MVSEKLLHQRKDQCLRYDDSPKIAYLTYEEAESRRPNIPYGARLETYPCRTCGFFHHGNPRAANWTHRCTDRHPELLLELGERVIGQISQENTGNTRRRLESFTKRFERTFKELPWRQRERQREIARG